MENEDRPKLELTEEDGYEALRATLVAKALAARAAHHPLATVDDVCSLLADPEVVRFPTTLAFDAAPLQAGEFAWAKPLGGHPRDGFTLVVHPHFEQRPEVLGLLVAYHVPTINYLDAVTQHEAELYGATLVGMEVEEYYRTLCRLADELPDTPDHEMQKRVVAQAITREPE